MLRKSQTLMLTAGMMAALTLFNIVGCANIVNRAQNGATQVQPKTISASDLKKLRWVEGTWRGTGDGQAPFFERYHFENESTLVVESFSDESLNKVSETTRFELKDGQFGNGGEGARWVATRLDDTSITFEPVARARNTFRWEMESKDVWKAVLIWPKTDSSPEKQRVYRMERWPLPKQ